MAAEMELGRILEEPQAPSLLSTQPFTSRWFLALDYVDFPGCNSVILFSPFLSGVPLLILFNDGLTE